MSTDLIFRRINAIIDEINRLQREIGIYVNQPSDREAYDIVCRIERKMRAVQAGGQAASVRA